MLSSTVAVLKYNFFLHRTTIFIFYIYGVRGLLVHGLWMLFVQLSPPASWSQTREDLNPPRCRSLVR